MDNIFLEIFNTGIMAGWLVLAVLLARLLLKNAPAWAKCALWAIVGVRLVWPFEIESILSLVPSAQTLPPVALTAPAPEIHTGFNALNSTINPTFTQTFQPEPAASVNPLQVVVAVASILWLAGMVAMAAYAALSYLRLRRRVRVSMPAGEGVYLCDHISSPFILGLIRPKIYMPSDLPKEKWDSILAHERAHLARRDHWWKPLGFLLLTVFWFHPLLWLAYILLCRDVELACDEKVIRTLSPEEKQAYSETLLECSMPRKWITACPLAFGETGVKQRIKAVLHYKKPTLWIIIAALIVCSVLAVCFLTEPAEQSDEPAIITEDDVANKQFVYIKPGAGSEFYINIYSDGTFQYYAGVYSSHIGLGDWELKDSKLYLYDTTLTNPMTFVFSVTEDALVYIAAESHPFMYVDVADGDMFRCYTDISIPDRPGTAATCLFDRDIPDTALQGEVALEDFQGISVRWDIHPKYITSEDNPVLVKDGKESILFENYPQPRSLYLADVTGDGKMDLCADVYYFLSGLPSFNAVCVYDIANDRYYMLDDRSVGSHITKVSYYLRLEEGRLLCDRVLALSLSYDILDTGTLYITESGELQLKKLESQYGSAVPQAVGFYDENSGDFSWNFGLSVSQNGTFSYSEGRVSSYIGFGNWEMKHGKLYLTDGNRCFVFEVREDGLAFIAGESDRGLSLEDGQLLSRRQMDAHLTFVEVTDIQKDHFLALDAMGNTWRIEYPCYKMGFNLSKCWVSYYGQPEIDEEGCYRVRAAECWLYREGDGDAGTIFDSYIFDVDGDGTAEYCYMTSVQTPSYISVSRLDQIVYKLIVTEADGTTYEADFLKLLFPDENAFGAIPSLDIDTSQISPVYAYEAAFAFVVENGKLLILAPIGAQYIVTGAFATYQITLTDDNLIVTQQ